MKRSHSIRVITYTFIGLLWLLAICLLFAVFLEYGGGIKLYQSIRYPHDPVKEQRQIISDLYIPFIKQNANPFTIFSFPLSPEERVAINNESVTLSPDGFRGYDPLHKGERELAFLIGGSTAFGHYSTSDETTITGYLNAKQERYFFINAGVPSFNTTQELHRVVDELIGYDPALIIALNGANDVMISLGYAQQGRDYPFGTPENFNLLEELVSGKSLNGKISKSLIQRAFPRLHAHASNRLQRIRGVNVSVPIHEWSEEDLSQGITKKYLLNMEILTKVTESFGGKFIPVLQPIWELHEQIPISEGHEFASLYRRFLENTLSLSSDISLYDFTRIFDTPIYASALGTLEENLPWESAFFVDNVHLTDNGNSIIADELIKILRSTK